MGYCTRRDRRCWSRPRGGGGLGSEELRRWPRGYLGYVDEMVDDVGSESDYDDDGDDAADDHIRDESVRESETCKRMGSYGRWRSSGYSQPRNSPLLGLRSWRCRRPFWIQELLGGWWLVALP